MAFHSAPVETPRSFTLFPELPEELRLMIWESALPGPRIVQLDYYREGDDSIQDGEWISSPCPQPHLFRTCRESRKVSFKQLTSSFPTLDSYFNPSVDMLVISWAVMYVAQHFPNFVTDVLEKVEHICLSSGSMEGAVALLDSQLLIDHLRSVRTVTLATQLGPLQRFSEPISIVDYCFESEDLLRASLKIKEFERKYAERYRGRIVPLVKVRALTYK